MVGNGRVVPFTQEVSAPIPDDLMVSTCDVCGLMYPTIEEAEKVYDHQMKWWESRK